jgi:hypothetical protein
MIDVFDNHPKQKKWCEATVLEESSTQVKVHFKVGSREIVFYLSVCNHVCIIMLCACVL